MRYLIGAVALVIAARTIPAQTPADSQCTYQACALRIERSFFNPIRVVSGASGDVIKGGASGQRLEAMLVGSDSATSYLRKYARANKRSTVLGLLGVGAYAFGFFHSDHYRHTSTGDAIAVVAGAVLVTASIPSGFAAQRHLSRAIWWYNESLPR